MEKNKYIVWEVGRDQRKWGEVDRYGETEGDAEKKIEIIIIQGCQ